VGRWAGRAAAHGRCAPAPQVAALARQIVGLWKDRVGSGSSTAVGSKAGARPGSAAGDAPAAVAKAGRGSGSGSGRAAAAAATGAQIRGKARELMSRALQEHCDAVQQASGAAQAAARLVRVRVLQECLLPGASPCAPASPCKPLRSC
jgi:predicted lipid-binding transport protein (Tim44 family)